MYSKCQLHFLPEWHIKLLQKLNILVWTFCRCKVFPQDDFFFRFYSYFHISGHFNSTALLRISNLIYNLWIITHSKIWNIEVEEVTTSVNGTVWVVYRTVVIWPREDPLSLRVFAAWSEAGRSSVVPDWLQELCCTGSAVNSSLKWRWVSCFLICYLLKSTFTDFITEKNDSLACVIKIRKCAGSAREGGTPLDWWLLDLSDLPAGMCAFS